MKIPTDMNSPMPQTETPLLAFGVEIYDMRAVVFAATNPKARWLAVKAYWEAGYGSKRVWPRPKAWREPRLDKYVATSNPTICYAEENLR